VDGVGLHHAGRGAGRPIVPIHGDAATGGDHGTGGVADLLPGTYRVIVSDRPGSGRSGRPRGRVWTAMRRAEPLHEALQQLRIERPVVVGHYWGAIVAPSLAAPHRADTAALVPLSGYHFWTPRPDVPLVAAGAIRVPGDMPRHTVSPWPGRLLMPLPKRSMFSPAPVTASSEREYSDAVGSRPSQVRATSVDGALTVPGAPGLRRRYDDLRTPACGHRGGTRRQGGGAQARRRARLHAAIPGSVPRIVEGLGPWCSTPRRGGSWRPSG
jgi:pimeloyl-ACP methyl ester carboxylesterase